MARNTRWIRLAVAGFSAAVLACRGTPAAGEAEPSVVPAAPWRITLSQLLPQLDSRRVRVTVMEVHYAPGDSSLPHRHPCAVVGHVTAGALRIQVEGGGEIVYRTGQSFYEGPDLAHLVSANASDREHAEFVAFFVCDRDTPLSVPLPGRGLPGAGDS